MLFKIFFIVVGVQSVLGLKLLPGLEAAKGKLLDTAGDVVGDLGKLLTGVPLALAQGVSGTGDWLDGIRDKIDARQSEVVRETFLARYKNAVLNRNEDTTLKFPELVRKYGYPCEEYIVRTDDGYLLTLFRIPFGVHSPRKEGVERPVVFLMHGLIDSADDWVIIGPGKALAYKLADAGYDVWLGNARGNTYSRRHVTRIPRDVSFWEFSWDEIGRFDLPAMIDFTLEKTGQKSVYYVGHSQGTTSFFVMCSMRPEYNAKIKIMFALAPIAWMHNMVSPMIRLLSPASKGADWIASTLGVGEFLPNNQLLAVAGGILCRDKAITQDLCSSPIFLATGFDVQQMNASMLPVFMGHSPAGSSVRQFLHYGQGVVSKDFRRFDFGDTNIDHYGQRVPPSYELSKITAPVTLMYSGNDWLSHPIDVKTLSAALGNMVDLYLVQNDRFNHMDYMWAIDSDKLVYDRILEMMKKY